MQTLYPVPDPSFARLEGLQRAGKEAMKAADLLEHMARGHAQRWSPLSACPRATAHHQLPTKSVSQRGLEKITATMTRELQMCVQVQFCSMLKVRNISGRKLQFRLGTDPTWKTSEHPVASATMATLSSRLSTQKLGWISLLRDRDKLPQHFTRRKLSKELLTQSHKGRVEAGV